MLIKVLGSLMVSAILLGLITACGQNGPNGQRGIAASGSTATSGSIVSVSNNADVTFTVMPAKVDGCRPDEPIVATVSWHTANPHVRVMVSTPAQPQPRLFSEGGYSGQAKTGHWVVANTRFELVDKTTDKRLAQAVITTSHCNGPRVTVQPLKSMP